MSLKFLAPLLMSCLILAACGKIDFHIAGQDKDKDDPHNPENVTVALQPLILISESDPHAANMLAAGDVASLEGVYDFKPGQETDVSLWITKFKPTKCGNVESTSPVFRWTEVMKDGSVGPATVVAPQEHYTVAAGSAQRLSVTMKTNFGRCQWLQLTFEAHPSTL